MFSSSPPPTSSNPKKSAAELRAGEAFWLDILIREARDVYAVSAVIEYPPSQIEVLEVAGNSELLPGEFLGPNAAYLAQHTTEIDEDIGYIHIACSAYGPLEGQAGTGRLFSLHLRALAGGVPTLKWGQNVAVLDAHQMPLQRRLIDLTTDPGEFENSGNGKNHLLMLCRPDGLPAISEKP